MHIFTRMSWNIQWNLRTYAISNLNLLRMSNVVHKRGTKRLITKLRMNICKMNNLITEQLNQLSMVDIFVLLHRLIESHQSYLKNRRGPGWSPLTGEIGVRRRGFPGQMKQKAGSPKVKRRNQRTPAWQMRLYLCLRSRWVQKLQ